MGQQIATQEQSQFHNSHFDRPSSQKFQNRQGFLKTSSYPFPHSTKITQHDTGTPIYVQRCKNLQQQIKDRKSQLKYFSKGQMLNLIESTVYPLVSLQQQGIIYKDITAQNIFVIGEKGKDSSQREIKCKFLPNDLIQETTYQRLQRINKRVIQQEKCFTFSPEMIIALRAREKQFHDLALLKKSGVFALGIVLLEATTLKYSYEFYDTVSFDIYEEVIEKCLEDIQKMYGSVIARIIANMIDFDFEERIQGFTELAKWILYQLQDCENNDLPNSQKNQPSEDKNLVPDSAKSRISLQTVNHEHIETLPVCFEKVSTKKLTQTLSMIEEKQKQKQNIQTQNKINIKVREVSVYLKNSHLQSDNQHKSRLLYSPFLNSISESKVSDFELRTSGKVDLVKQYSRRGLAFESGSTKTKKSIFGQNIIPISINTKTHR